MGQKITTENLKTMGLLPSTGATTTRDHNRDDIYPQLGYKVLIVGDCFRSGIVEMFAKAGCKIARTVEEADLVCYSGGEDVDPQLYGEKPLRSTYFSASRDAAEMDVFAKCVELDKPQFGICRGHQFLAVMNGCKLWQDVDNHGWRHRIELVDGTKPDWHVSSMHHQMVIPNDTTFPLAWALAPDGKSNAVSGEYVAQSRSLSSNAHKDLEAAIFPNIRAITVQGHPEVGGYPEYTIWCLNEVKKFVEFGMTDNAPTTPISDVGFIARPASSLKKGISE